MICDLGEEELTGDRWQVAGGRSWFVGSLCTSGAFMDVGYMLVTPSTVVAIGIVDVFAFEFALTKKRDDASCSQRFLQTRKKKHET